MPNSFTIGQTLARELGLPEAQDAPTSATFALPRLMEWQEVRMRELEARRKKRKQPTFLPPDQKHRFGILNKDTLEK